MKQKTIKNIVSITGVGLHSGKLSTLKLTPEPCDRGVIFYLNMLKAQTFIFSPLNVCDTMLATKIGSSDCFVSTVEHLMAVLHARGITNIGIGVTGPEIPILNGASDQLYNLISAAEIVEQEKDAKIKKVIQPFNFKVDENCRIDVFPDDEFRLTYCLENNNIACIKKQTLYKFRLEDFKEIYKAKTFGKFEDLEKLRSMGLIKGGTEENAIVYSESGEVLNPGVLNNRLDFVHHKALDFIGDIYALGLVHGHFVVKNSGHTSNNAFCREFLKREGECYEISN